MRADMKRLRRDTGPERTHVHAAATMTAGTAAAATAAPAQSGVTPSRSAITTAIRQRPKTFATAAVLLIGLIAIALVAYTKRTPAYTERDTILLTDFVNTTGESAFDGTLRQALTVNLEQSPYFLLVSQDRIRETLGYMGRRPGEPLTEPVGREICQRLGIKALMLGSIASLGSRYIVTLSAMNAQTGETIASAQQEAPSRENVLQALGSLSSEIRRRLGESLASIERFAAPPEQATTSSLEALKAYTEATRVRGEGRELDAAVLFERAVQLDPNFAMAHARLAAIYRNEGEYPKAFAAATQAYELRDRVSERERFYIESGYYSSRGENARQRKTYEAWKQTYPRDTPPRNNLAIVLEEAGEFEAAVQEASAANRLDPAMPFAYANLCRVYIALNKLGEARAITLKGIEVRPAYPELHACLYKIGFLEKDEATMRRAVEYSKEQGGTVSARMQSLEIQVLVATGKLKKAQTLFEPLVRRLDQSSRRSTLSEMLSGASTEFAAVGAMPQAVMLALRAVQFSDSAAVPWLVPMTLFAAGEARQASAFFARNRKAFAADSSYTDVWVPLIEGVRELAARDPKAALSAVSVAVGRERAVPAVALTRGQALLGLDRAAEAAAAFEQAIAGRFVNAPSVLGPVAQIWLGRAQAQAGDAAAARRAYQDAFAAWKDADADLPILVQAKKEYAALR